jgi:hypothetical protein
MVECDIIFKWGKIKRKDGNAGETILHERIAKEVKYAKILFHYNHTCFDFNHCMLSTENESFS